MLIDKSNNKAYTQARIVNLYSHLTDLQKSEETVLNFLKNDLAGMKMLDIGVGGGRTTLHFAKLVREYIGIDCSEEMIAACQKRFSNHSEHISFQVCDVRNMTVFENHTFDFILFSFNGIDYISHEDRLKAFAEIKRILKSGGYFCFSSHNLQSIDKLFEFKKQIYLQIGMPKKIVRWFLTRFVFNKNANISELKNCQFAVFNDGAERWGIQTYYIKPAEQIKQLQALFDEIRVFLLENGTEVDQDSNLGSIDDDWLYYLCK